MDWIKRLKNWTIAILHKIVIELNYINNYSSYSKTIIFDFTGLRTKTFPIVNVSPCTCDRNLFCSMKGQKKKRHVVYCRSKKKLHLFYLWYTNQNKDCIYFFMKYICININLFKLYKNIFVLYVLRWNREILMIRLFSEP